MLNRNIVLNSLYIGLKLKFCLNENKVNILHICLESNEGGFIYITVTILNFTHRLVFYLKHQMTSIRTTHETHYVSATSPTGQCDLQVYDGGISNE
jgi:hypothetical protein